MSQLHLPPEVEELLAVWRDRLPIGTELEGYMVQDPDAAVIYATQPSSRRGEHLAASVWISEEAINDHGQLHAVAPALDMLVKLAARCTNEFGDELVPMMEHSITEEWRSDRALIPADWLTPSSPASS